MTLEWFVDWVRRQSRQRLTTMGKRAGVAPYRRRDEWRFRTARGSDRTLEQVFAALQSTRRGQQWLRDEYETPMRLADSSRRLQAEREQALRDRIVAVCDFLPREFGYSAPFALPARIKDRVIVAYRHDHAARQVEISADEGSFPVHCEIRRLIDGVPGAYGPDSIADWELRMMRRWFGDDEILVDRDQILRRIATTLRKHADILRGEAWIDRENIDDRWSRQFSRKFGFSPAPRGTPGRLEIARERAAFLVAKHGFVLEFDSSTLSPHESEMWRKLRYRRGDTTVEIANTDIRVPDEWSVRVNGVVVSAAFEDWDQALAEALAEVSRRI
jgi:hypothetical protein